MAGKLTVLESVILWYVVVTGRLFECSPLCGEELWLSRSRLRESVRSVLRLWPGSKIGKGWMEGSETNTSSAPPLVSMPTPPGLFPLSENALLYLSDAQAQACEVSVPGGNTNKPV